MKKKTEKKLTLAQHTIATLANPQLQHVAGAAINLSNFSTCPKGSCFLSDFC